MLETVVEFISKPIFTCVIFGILIELVFRMLKSVDNANSLDFPYQEYVPVPLRAYLSIIEYVNGASKFSLLNYGVFRFTPPFMVLMLQSSVLLKYYATPNIWFYLVFTVLVSILFRDLKILVGKRYLSAEKLVASANIFALIALALLVGILARLVDLKVIAPSISGMTDNLWSSLFASVLVAMYIGAINQNKNMVDTEVVRSRQAQEGYVVSSFYRINSQYGEVIKQACAKNNTAESLLYAVLIYENMNRPSWLRGIENLAVKVSHVELTVGIAQVKSRVPLSDGESINIAAKILSNTAISNQLMGAKLLDRPIVKNKVTNYNKGNHYIEQLGIILDALTLHSLGLDS